MFFEPESYTKANLSFYWQSGPEDCGHLPTVLRAAVLPAPLWLRYASGEVCADCGREFKAEVPRRERERAFAQGTDGRQHGQVSVTGCAFVSGDTSWNEFSCSHCLYFFSVGALAWFINYSVRFSCCHPQGIISDLFPGIVLPKPDYELLLKALNDNIAKLNLQPVPWFIGKIIQVPRRTAAFHCLKRTV